MPPKNQTKQYNSFKNVKYTPIEDLSSSFNQTEDEKNKKSVYKPGRTLLVKYVSGSTIDDTVFDSLEGLSNKSETKSSNSCFLTFDNVDNAVKAFRKLNDNLSHYRVKFSYYRVFFTIDGLDDSTDYNQTERIYGLCW